MSDQTPVIPVAEYAVTNVTASAQLAELCQQWADVDVLSVDCEFQRERTFFPIAALFQICDGRAIYLIDPLLVKDFSPLISVFKNPKITKVLHSCGEDLEVFRVFLGALPEPLFDTQLAAAFLGAGFSMSYRQLVVDHNGVELDKSETRSDWLKRPLSEAQNHYAAEDVRYLPAIFESQKTQLEEAGKWSWFEADCATIIAAAKEEEDFGTYYQKVKGAWKLDQKALAVLRELSRWREIEARKRDLPRRWLLADQALRELAVRQPGSVAELADIQELPPKTIRKQGEKLLSLIQDGLACDASARPARLPEPLASEQRNVLKKLKSCVKERAEELGMCGEVLARKKDFESLMQSGPGAGAYQLPNSLQGWREEVVGTRLLTILTGERL